MKPCDKNCQCQIFHEETLTEVKKTLYKDDEFKNMAEIFKILNDPSRLKILGAIKDHDLCVCDLGSLLGISKSAISHQMKFLKQYNLVKSERKGKMVYYRLDDYDVREMITHAHSLLKGFYTHEKNN